MTAGFKSWVVVAAWSLASSRPALAEELASSRPALAEESASSRSAPAATVEASDASDASGPSGPPKVLPRETRQKKAKKSGPDNARKVTAETITVPATTTATATATSAAAATERAPAAPREASQEVLSLGRNPVKNQPEIVRVDDDSTQSSEAAAGQGSTVFYKGARVKDPGLREEKIQYVYLSRGAWLIKALQPFVDRLAVEVIRSEPLSEATSAHR